MSTSCLCLIFSRLHCSNFLPSAMYFIPLLHLSSLSSISLFYFYTFQFLPLCFAPALSLSRCFFFSFLHFILSSSSSFIFQPLFSSLTFLNTSVRFILTYFSLVVACDFLCTCFFSVIKMSISELRLFLA